MKGYGFKVSTGSPAWYGIENDSFFSSRDGSERAIGVYAQPYQSFKTTSDVRPEIWERTRESFYSTALRILYTLTPAILILDGKRRIVFANHQAEELLERGDVISRDGEGRVCCTDHVAQDFLLQSMTTAGSAHSPLFSKDKGSFFIPKADGWPMVAVVGHDQAGALPSDRQDLDVDRHITLMIRDPNGRHPEQSEKLLASFGLSGAELSVVGELIKGHSTSQIAEERGVSVVTIRNQLKSAQSKMGVTRQSELVSLVLRYIS